MEEADDSGRLKKTVFVTVGTTCFDALVKVVDTLQVKEELSRKGYTDLFIQMGRQVVDTQQVKEESSRKGYTDLFIQMGRGSYIPSKSSGEHGSLAVDYFTFSPSIAEYMRSASLIISHAGSGSISESLRLSKPLIVVVNEDLMDNHQIELAEELAERKHLLFTCLQTLYETVRTMDLKSLVPYPSADATPVSKLIGKFFGFPD